MRGSDTKSAWPRLAAWLPMLLATVGCETMSVGTRPTQPPGVTGGANSSMSSDPVATTFRSEVGPEQEYSVHMDLARLHDRQGNAMTAITEYSKALAICDRPAKFFGNAKLSGVQKAQAHRRMANAMDRIGQFGQAETHYRLALECNPGDANVWNDAGYSYYLQSRWSDAERCLKTAAQINPSDPRIVTNLGLALAAAGRSAEAYEYMALVTHPAVAHANLGYILAATGRTEEARSHYQAAIQLQPQMASAQVALAKLDTQVQAASATAAAGQRGAQSDPSLFRASTATGIPLPRELPTTTPPAP